MPILHTTETAGKALKVGRNTVWRLVRDRKLAAVNIGSEKRPRWRITEEALQEYAESLPAAETQSSAERDSRLARPA